MLEKFGQSRVLKPKGYFPVSSWKIDNSEELRSGEMRVSIERIKVEEGSFRQLCNSCNYKVESIRERIINLVEERGKLHNHLTNSGGICLGTVEEIDDDYPNEQNLKVGDKVIGIVSLTSIPIKIEKVKNINFNYGQIEVEGYGIFFSTSPVSKLDLPIHEEILLSAYDESGSIAKAGKLAKDGSRFLILSSKIMMALIYAAAVKFSNNSQCHITVLLELDPMPNLPHGEIEKMLRDYVDELHITAPVSPVENYRLLNKKTNYTDPEMLFDSSIVCSNMLGVEAIGVLLTKNGGNLFFTNLVNDHNTTVLFTESLGKNLNIISQEGYTATFPQYTKDIVKSVKEKLLQIHETCGKYGVISQSPVRHTDNYNLFDIKNVDGYAFKSAITREMLEYVLNIANYDCNVIISGETGVGKERIMDIIHENSSRKGQRCVRVNCSAISGSLAESELFGYEEGAFTGAKKQGKKGFFELANNGILFLDEIGDLPLSLQAKFLRVIQEESFYRVGGEMPVDVNFRLVCATNKDLKKMVEDGDFREDLYYRLNICEVKVPPLRERIDDIDAIVEVFTKKYNDRYTMNKGFTLEAFDELKKYDWPGNIRELDNVVHRLLVNTKENAIDDVMVRTLLENKVNLKFASHTLGASNEQGKNDSDTETQTLDSIMENHEKAAIGNALEKCRTTKEAAEMLGISQSQLMRKKKKYNL